MGKFIGTIVVSLSVLLMTGCGDSGKTQISVQDKGVKESPNFEEMPDESGPGVDVESGGSEPEDETNSINENSYIENSNESDFEGDGIGPDEGIEEDSKEASAPFIPNEKKCVVLVVYSIDLAEGYFPEEFGKFVSELAQFNNLIKYKGKSVGLEDILRCFRESENIDQFGDCSRQLKLDCK